MSRVTLQRVLLTASTVLFICFIFSNSLKTGETSGQSSQMAQIFLMKIFEKLQIDISLTEFVIRKVAHFTEFFVLGLLLIGNLWVYFPKWKECIFPFLFLALLVPVIDETLQIFTPGRSPMVTDILIDFGGAICGLIIFSIVRALFCKKNATPSTNG